MIAQDNKPSEVESKLSIMKIHLEPMFGSKRIDEIDIGAINRFRASLLQKKLSKKRVNNISPCSVRRSATRMTSR